jgi:hypothetical protein
VKTEVPQGTGEPQQVWELIEVLDNDGGGNNMPPGPSQGGAAGAFDLLPEELQRPYTTTINLFPGGAAPVPQASARAVARACKPPKLLTRRRPYNVLRLVMRLGSRSCRVVLISHMRELDPSDVTSITPGPSGARPPSAAATSASLRRTPGGNLSR